MDANQAMLLVAENTAKEYGYIEVGKRTIDAMKDNFWGNNYLGVKAMMEGRSITVESCKYIIPMFEEDREKVSRRPKIEIDMHFGKPRLGIDLPSGTSCFLTYRDNICTEAQAFGNNGLAFALSIKDKIDYLINN
ncbi:MAG: hypothetical protein IKU25_00455 [Clostridia bacterium]|nr:hypothetical protein [Clostridia bacterium]MBR5271856.1 hypothetical protein [Clostridia bacterium]